VAGRGAEEGEGGIGGAERRKREGVRVCQLVRLLVLYAHGTG